MRVLTISTKVTKTFSIKDGTGIMVMLPMHPSIRFHKTIVESGVQPVTVPPAITDRHSKLEDGIAVVDW
jgi:hypothetical protein